MYYLWPYLRYLLLYLIVLNRINDLNASILDEIVSLESSYKQEISMPDPNALHPQWWDYFNVEREELRNRTTQVSKNLQELYKTLTYEEQAIASPLINKIIATLNVLPEAKVQTAVQSESSRPFLKQYTLEKQLELNQQLRELRAEIKNEKDNFEQLQAKLLKVQKNIDNMFALYLQSPSSSKKRLNGLDIMAYRANVGLGEQNFRLGEERLNVLYAKLKRLEEEITYAKHHMDVQSFDEVQLERAIAISQQELDERQKALAVAEANLLGVFTHADDKAHSFLLEQQALQASVNRAHAWSILSFNMFKYNIIMFLNGRFKEGQEGDLRNNLNGWLEKIAVVTQQTQEWQKTALKEQERIRQEYAFLIADNEDPYSQKMQYNQSLSQGVLQTLTALELLDEAISNTEFLIGVLDEHFKKNSSFLHNAWIAISDSISRSWTNLFTTLNYSLFKLGGIPITLFTLLKIILILAVSFALSVFLRSSLRSYGNKCIKNGIFLKQLKLILYERL